MLNNKVVLITGGTGSLGHALTERLLKTKLKKLIILSRDEFKQDKMSQKYTDSRLRFFLGDVRDVNRLKRGFKGVDYVLHTAALKQVPASYYNPLEFVKTNIIGSQNVIDASIDCGVKKVIFTNTDKGCLAANLYGATKYVAECLFVNGSSYSDKTIFACVRYGNVTGSRGSVIPLWKNASKINITDTDMTRFWMLIDESVDLILHALRYSKQGEIYIPRLQSYNILDLARVMKFKKHQISVIGIRPGEKIHETLISEHELDNVYYDIENNPEYYVIYPYKYQFKKLGQKILKMAYTSRESVMDVSELKERLEGI